MTSREARREGSDAFSGLIGGETGSVVFVDHVRVHLRSGDGGAGAVSFKREGRRPSGKPVGGSGGRGGRVVIVADRSKSSLHIYRRHPHLSAGSGSHGSADLRHGRRGEDLLVPVPLGTTVFDHESRLVADLVHHGQRAEVLSGGRGGRGNASLSSPDNRAPGFCEQGEYGVGAWFTLEMKLIADAALIGFPNAGKSTLLAGVTAARPKIGDYPFTTMQPNLGLVVKGDQEFVLADVPGLVEGAAEGRGLGHEFLRHCERARVLVILLDPSPLQTASTDQQYEILCRELEEHDPRLAARPRVVAVNKMDLRLPDAIPAALRRAVPDVASISAVTGEGVDDLVYRISALVEGVPAAEATGEGFVLHRPVPMSFTVGRTRDRWVVEGRAAERAVALNDLTTAEAAGLVARRLTRLGVDGALRRAGAEQGDVVRIGEHEFEYREEDDDRE